VVIFQDSLPAKYGHLSQKYVISRSGELISITNYYIRGLFQLTQRSSVLAHHTGRYQKSCAPEFHTFYWLTMCFLWYCRTCGLLESFLAKKQCVKNFKLHVKKWWWLSPPSHTKLRLCLNVKFSINKNHFTEFVQFIVSKIIKIVAIRCPILRLKCNQIDFGCHSDPDPAGGAYSAPQTH